MDDLYTFNQSQDNFNCFDFNTQNDNDYFSSNDELQTERNDFFHKNRNNGQNDTSMSLKKILKIEDEKNMEKNNENIKKGLISIDVNSDKTMGFDGKLKIKSFSFNDNDDDGYDEKSNCFCGNKKREREININNNSDNNNEIINERKKKIISHPSNNLFIIKNYKLPRRIDYIIKIIKPFMIDILTIFANTLIEKYKKDDSGNTIIISPLFKINGDQASECNVELNKDFLQKTLRYILSAPLTTKIKQYNPEYPILQCYLSYRVINHIFFYKFSFLSLILFF